MIAESDTHGRGGTLGGIRADVVERLRARRAEIEEVIFARVRDGVSDRAGSEDAEYVAGLRAAVAAAVEYGLEGIERGEEWVGPIPAMAVEQARRAVRVGVSLDTVLRRYVVGHTLLGEFVMDEAERDGRALGQRSALREALRAQASVLDRLLAALTSEYGDELARVGRSPEQRRAERVRRLLDGAVSEGSELDYDLDAWHVGVIAVGVGAEPAVRELAAGVDRRILSVPQGGKSVWAWLGGREGFAIGDLERVVSGAAASEGVVLALGEPARGIDGWRLTHHQAQAALLVALNGPSRFTRYAEVMLLAAALRDETLARSLHEIYLSPLASQRDGGAVSRETLRAYFKAGRNASSAAPALNVVRHTVESRLQIVEQLLGRPLQTCLVELEVALRLEEFGVAGSEKAPLSGD